MRLRKIYSPKNSFFFFYLHFSFNECIFGKTFDGMENKCGGWSESSCCNASIKDSNTCACCGEWCESACADCPPEVKLTCEEIDNGEV